MDYYATLGLKRGASDAEIKKAYRSMAMKHHPDRGGDEKKFKEIEEAYRTLSDPQKKQMFDMGMDPNNQGMGGFNQGPFEFHFGTGNMDDIFNHFGFGFGSRPLRKNKSINIMVDLMLEDVLSGKDLTAEINLPSGSKKMINISIPPGVDNGQQIRYQGMGDNSIPGVPPGDLFVNINIRPHQIFKREGDSIVYDHLISAWDAILGTSLEIKTLDGRTLNINVPKGTQPDSILSCREEGLPNMRTRRRGNLLVRIKIEIPRNLNSTQMEKVKNLKDGI